MIEKISHAVWAITLLASPLVAVLIFFYLLAISALALFGARGMRATRVRKALTRCIWIITVLISCGWLSYYVWLTELRPSAHACTTQATYDGRYKVTQCLLDAGYDLLQVRDAMTSQLLAERTYSCEPSAVGPVAGQRAAFDGCAPEDSYITLPPTRLDRLRALLP